MGNFNTNDGIKRVGKTGISTKNEGEAKITTTQVKLSINNGSEAKITSTQVKLSTENKGEKELKSGNFGGNAQINKNSSIKTRMINVGILIKRNTKIYFREKSNIFFSILSTLILVALHFIVFRKMFFGNWVSIVTPMNISMTDKQIYWLVDALMFAAIIPISAVTVSLTALGRMVSDRQENCINDFMVSPLKRTDLFFGYILSSFLIGLAICLGFLVLFEIYFLAMYQISFSALQLVYLILSTILALVFGNVFMLFIITFVKNEQTMGAVGIIVGTLIGFLGGAYVPVSMLGKGIASAIGVMPFLPLTVLSRKAMLLPLEKLTPLTFDIFSGELAVNFSLEMQIGKTIISPYGIFAIVMGYVVALLAFLIWRFKNLNKKS